MKITKILMTNDYELDNAEIEKAVSMAREIVSVIKKNNPTYAMADQALDLSKVMLKDSKII